MTAIRPLHLLIAVLFAMTARADTDSDTDLKKIMQDLQSDSALVVLTLWALVAQLWWRNHGDSALVG